MDEALAEANQEFKHIQALYERGVDKPGQAWYGSTFKKEPGLIDTHKKRAIKALKRALDIAKEANLKNEVNRIQSTINTAKSL
jgi:hypothetical protein